MKIDFSKMSSIPSVFDTETLELELGADFVVEEVGVRRLKDMKTLFLDGEIGNDEFPLYFMYNGIYNLKHKDFIKGNGFRYEYTILMDQLINNEHIKAHGHIHAYDPIKKRRHLEAYEILHGSGQFQLFKFKDKRIEVIILETKVGDYFIIPEEYYHLSINTGNEPFIFGDVIPIDVENDYGYLKERNGAPFYALQKEDESLVYRKNSNYDEFELEISFLTVDNLPWENPIEKVPLYAHLITNPKKFEFLK